MFSLCSGFFQLIVGGGHCCKARFGLCGFTDKSPFGIPKWQSILMPLPRDPAGELDRRRADDSAH